MTPARLLAVALLGAAAWVSGAIAQGPGAGAGWYLGGGIRPTPATDDADIGYRNFGGYRFTRNWGVELGYADLGRNSSLAEPWLAGTAHIGSQPSAWTLAGTGVLPLGNAFSLRGRLGLSVLTPDASASSAGGALASTLQSVAIGAGSPRYRPGVLWGFGGQYDVNGSFGLRLDYNNFGRLSEELGGARSDLWSINAVVRF
jgi:OmpA-OmpF porin, OOP family